MSNITWINKNPGDQFTSNEANSIVTAVNSKEDALPLGGTTGQFLKHDKTWGIPTSGATNLSYAPSLRILSSSTGSGTTLPVVDTTNAGLMLSADKLRFDVLTSVGDTDLDSGAQTTKYLSVDSWTKIKARVQAFLELITFDKAINFGATGSLTSLSGGKGFYGTSTEIKGAVYGVEVLGLNTSGIKHSAQTSAGVVNTDSSGQELSPIPIVASNFSSAEQSLAEATTGWVGGKKTITGLTAGKEYYSSSTKYTYKCLALDECIRIYTAGVKQLKDVQIPYTTFQDNVTLIKNQCVIGVGTFPVPACVVGDILHFTSLGDSTINGFNMFSGSVFSGTLTSGQFVKLQCVVAPNTFINIS